MVKKRKGRSVRQNKQVRSEADEDVQAPHSFIIHRGLPGGHITEITRDFRKVMEPFTASTLKERKRNTIKDFLSIAGVLHVSHIGIFTRTEFGMYMKIAKVPRGPTLSFKVHSFTLAKDVISSLKKQFVYDKVFKHSPLVVLNNFSGEGMHMKLMASTFQNMFPTINLTNINLNTIRRVVLLNYNPTSKLIDFRHYAIKVIPVGLSKGVKKVVQGKIPNLSRCEDIADFLTKTAILSESEFEDDANNQVTVPQKLSSRGNIENNQSAIRLSELGPRLTIQLIKVEDGLLDGAVLFHELVHKTEEEIVIIHRKREKKRKLKENRKNQQEQNQKKKEEKKEILKQKSLQGMHQKGKTESDLLMRRAAKESNQETNLEEDDDAEYYRQEVGEEPDKDLFSSRLPNRKRPLPASNFGSKKPRIDNKSRDKWEVSKFENEKNFRSNKKSFDPDSSGSKFDKKQNFKSNRKSFGADTRDKSNGFKFDNKKKFKSNDSRGKPGGSKFDKKKNFKSNRSSSGGKWPGGRGGNPTYGHQAQNSEDNNSGTFSGNKGKKVHGSKINKFKNKRR